MLLCRQLPNRNGKDSTQTYFPSIIAAIERFVRHLAKKKKKRKKNKKAVTLTETSNRISPPKFFLGGTDAVCNHLKILRGMELWT